jgi:uncharacterized cupin superfamily protein
MKKINVKDIPESFATSPKGKYARGARDLSIALGRKPGSFDLRERQPFDVQIFCVPPGKARSPFHLHTAQFEFFHVLSGAGAVRHRDGITAVEAGDSFQFGPGEPHQLINDGKDDFVVMVVADNPVGEACFYPDSNKWSIETVDGPILKAESTEYFDGEE